jgi:hypothetical protein
MSIHSPGSFTGARDASSSRSSVGQYRHDRCRSGTTHIRPARLTFGRHNSYRARKSCAGIENLWARATRSMSARKKLCSARTSCIGENQCTSLRKKLCWHDKSPVVRDTRYVRAEKDSSAATRFMLHDVFVLRGPRRRARPRDLTACQNVSSRRQDFASSARRQSRAEKEMRYERQRTSTARNAPAGS